ncbi:MAG: 6,7-dimethyl-8-ribityllumazine synthase [Flavobacteriales bacterium]
MATAGKKSSSLELAQAPDGQSFRIGIACAQWNEDITEKLLEGTLNTLLEKGVREENIRLYFCPGAFELPLTSQWLLEDGMDGVIAIGSVIQGETRHFEFVCNGVTQGIMDLNLKFGKPVIFCVLTDETHAQAKERSGGKHGNKGIDSAIALLKMLGMRQTTHKGRISSKKR